MQWEEQFWQQGRSMLLQQAGQFPQLHSGGGDTLAAFTCGHNLQFSHATSLRSLAVENLRQCTNSRCSKVVKHAASNMANQNRKFSLTIENKFNLTKTKMHKVISMHQNKNRDCSIANTTDLLTFHNSERHYIEHKKNLSACKIRH